MTAFLCLWLLHAPDQLQLPLQDLDLYRETSFTLYKTEAGYLLNSGTEAGAVLFNNQGDIIGRYDKRGKGPDAFHAQFVLGVDHQGIHFCTGRRHILSFDHHMKLKKKAAFTGLSPEFNVRAGFGVFQGKGRVLLPLLGKGYLVTELAYRDGVWSKVRDAITTQGEVLNPKALILAERALFHGNTLFKARVGIRNDEEHYEVMVYREFMDQNDEAPTLALTAPVEDLPAGRGLRCMIYSVASVSSGYVVEVFSDLKKNSKGRRWHDHFDPRGGFIKRVNRDDTRLLPVINGAETFLITEQGDRRVLQRFDKSFN